MNYRYGILDRMNRKVIRVVDTFDTAKQIIDNFNEDNKIRKIKRVVMIKM
ncbi:hypothetical protein [Fusobacterium perfoetens]|nr:hypothetical protein [Fusobacterium perfoetens]MCF2611804.1 hypothetical protein [Fusobacterium perfoetens]